MLTAISVGAGEEFSAGVGASHAIKILPATNIVGTYMDLEGGVGAADVVERGSVTD